nr:unknown [Zea mays]
MEEHAVQVLVLAHAYQVPWLKRACEGAIGARLTADSVVDVLQLAGLCDAPRLHLRCARLLAKEFAAVERTEAWRFLQENDPWQELHVLQRLHEADMRRRKWRRKRAEQRVYMELSEAMDCLDHICTEGCTEVGPAGRAPAPAPCARYATCRGLQLLIRHFSQCHRKSCARCQRMWQLLRLHSALCDRTDRCNTPLCMRFKQQEQDKAAAKGGDDGDKWGLLVKKVKTARVFSSLANRKQMSTTTTQC